MALRTEGKTTMELEIVQAHMHDWHTFADWAGVEGWNLGPADGPCFLAQDPDGFFVGRVDGEPVSAVSVVNYGEEFSFLGRYLVHPEHRGRGYGRATWDAAMRHAGPRTVGLNAVPARQALFERSGFSAAYRTVRHVGEFAQGAEPSTPSHGVDVAAVDAVSFEDLLAYDGLCFPAERGAFLRRWLRAPGHVGRVALADGRVAGYGVIRRAPSFAKIGPLFADDAETAATLVGALTDGLRHALGRSGPLTAALDVPEVNPAAVALAERYGMKPISETVRMYSGPVRDVDHARVFGKTTSELG
jgi:GNAT superfamily N-acetyltransferase